MLRPQISVEVLSKFLKKDSLAASMLSLEFRLAMQVT